MHTVIHRDKCFKQKKIARRPEEGLNPEYVSTLGLVYPSIYKVVRRGKAIVPWSIVC